MSTKQEQMIQDAKRIADLFPDSDAGRSFYALIAAYEKADELIYGIADAAVGLDYANDEARLKAIADAIKRFDQELEQ